MSRKAIGWVLIIASFVLAGFLAKVGAIGDLVTVALLVGGGVIVWQENVKAARAQKDKSE